MKTKAFSLFAVFALSFILVASIVSATLDDVQFIPDTFNKQISVGDSETSINFQLNETVSSSHSLILSGTSSMGNLTFDSSAPASINADEVLLASVLLKDIPSSFVGTITGTIILNDSSTSTLDILPITITVNGPSEGASCSALGNQGNLEIRKIDLNNRGMDYATFGDDDEWYPFEEIEVEIEVKNDGDYDISDVSVEWGLWDKANNEWAVDFDEVDEVNIDHGDKETFMVSFKLDTDLDVDLEDLSNNNGNYLLYVTARGVVDDNDAPFNGADTCASDFEPATMQIDNDLVILDNFQYPNEVQCSEDVQVLADLWNIGDDDQEDVYVLVRGSSLGVNNRDVTVGEDPNAFEDAPFEFSFQIPDDAEEKVHYLTFEVRSNDHSGDIYTSELDDVESRFVLPVTVSGNCIVETNLDVNAAIESGGQAGKDLVVRATFTNNGNERATYTVGASGYSSWASSADLDVASLTLNAGESADVLITLPVKDTTKGTQSFNIDVISGSRVVMTQPVSVSIQEKSGFFSSITGAASAVTGDNWYLWMIGLVNVLLVVGIVVVVVRMYRRG